MLTVEVSWDTNLFELIELYLRLYGYCNDVIISDACLDIVKYFIRLLIATADLLGTDE